MVQLVIDTKFDLEQIVYCSCPDYVYLSCSCCDGKKIITGEDWLEYPCPNCMDGEQEHILKWNVKQCKIKSVFYGYNYPNNGQYELIEKYSTYEIAAPSLDSNRTRKKDE
jgi:hypothetical protein